MGRFASPEVLGDRRAAFEAAITEALEPFACDGLLEEQINSVATVVR